MWMIAFPLTAPSQEPAPGIILEKVVCLNNANQSYSIYLPSKYSSDRKWPIIFAFDADARGPLPVRRFKAVAEKYGYIIAGSNNSRNGPMAIIEEALNALITDTESRFSLDDRRMYMTGFSGGARVAVAAAAAMKGKIAGVIGCGAGFHPEIPLSDAKSFAFFGAVGTEDFNFPELKALDDRLEKQGAVHKLEIFPGGHEWPPEWVCTRAIEWMEIQAMQTGRQNPDADRIDELYSKAVAAARSYDDMTQTYEAYRHYSDLVKDFAGLEDVSPFQAIAARLKKSGEIKKAIRQENNIIERQKRLEDKISLLLEGAAYGENRAYRIQDLMRLFISLQEQANQKRNEADRLVAVRALNLFWIRLNKDAATDIENKNYNGAAMRLELLTQIRPDNPQVFYHLSRIYALGGNRKDALKALRNAVEKGFKNATELVDNPDFEKIRGDPDFLRILGTINK